MLNTKKLLYILPDSAYIAELLPTKKAHTFAIQTFRQINGEFIDENEFIADHIEKLIKKIEPEEYHLILPDFLFTNTIVDVADTDEAKVKAYLKEKLLPSLELSKDTHEIDTFILTQHQKKSKVQLSALEKSLLIPIQKAAAEQKVNISHISPLSWTIKSIISLEPSLSTIQIGGMLYLAQHYIGIDQTTSFKIEEVENIVETVKTLKGAEPNIQTMYLLTNPLIENQIKEKLSGTLPIQQLSNFTDELEGMPAYVKQIIEAGAKTLDIPDHPVPRFSLAAALPASTESQATPEAQVDSDKTTASATTPEATSSTVEAPADLPAPTAPPAAITEVKPEKTVEPISLETPATAPAMTVEEKPAVHKISLDEDTSAQSVTAAVPAVASAVTAPVSSVAATTVTTVAAPAAGVAAAVVTGTPAAVEAVAQKVETSMEKPAQTQVTSPVAVENPVITQPQPVVAAPSVAPTPLTTTPIQPKVISMTTVPQPQPASTPISTNVVPLTQPMTETTPTFSPTSEQSSMSQPSAPRQVIKNKNDAGSLVKVIFITLGALIATVVIGIGVGFGLLKLSEKNNSPLNHTPVVVSPAPVATPVAVASPMPTPAPAASSSATINKAKYKILVVNATGVAGKAGKTKSALTAAGYKNVSTGNAKGTYSDKGDFLLVDSTHEGDLTTLQKDSQLSLTLGTSTQKDAEDPKAAYDAVIVVNQ